MFSLHVIAGITEPKCESKVDLCLIIDSSGSIRNNNPADGSYDNWALQLGFLSDLIGAFTIGADATRVGAVVFSEQVRLEFPLDRYASAAQVQQAIAYIAYMGETTNTPEALRQTRQQCFSEYRGDRPDAANLAIIVTDGFPYPEERRDPAIAEAQALRATGVTMIAVGVTAGIDADFLRHMSSPPQLEGQNFFTAADFTALQPMLRGLAYSTCQAVSEDSESGGGRLLFILQGWAFPSLYIHIVRPVLSASL